MGTHHDKLQGGKADGMRPKDFPRRELKDGAKHELEHTKNKSVATEIAMDHLAEDPKYYKKLSKIEKTAMYSGFFDELEKIASSSVNEKKAIKAAVQNYEEFRSKLKPGDIILSDGRQEYEPAWALHFFKPMSNYYQRSRFGHSALYVGGDHIIDARIERPTLKSSLKDLVEKNHVIALSPNVSDEDRAKAINYAHDQIGRSYSFLGLVRAGLGFKGTRAKMREHSDAMICSALVANAYAHKKFSEGSRLFVQPAEILRSKAVTPVAMLMHPEPAKGSK